MAAAGVDASNVERGSARAAAARPRRQRPGAAPRGRRADRRQRRRRRHRHRRPGLADRADRHRDRRRRARRARRPRRAHRRARQRARGHGAGARRRAGRRGRAGAGQADRASVRAGARPRRPGAAGRRGRARAPRRWSGPRARTCSGTAPARRWSARWPATRPTGHRSVRRPRPRSSPRRSPRCWASRRRDRAGALVVAGPPDPRLAPLAFAHGWVVDPPEVADRVKRSDPSLRRLLRRAPASLAICSPPSTPPPRYSVAVAKKPSKSDRQAVIDEIRTQAEGRREAPRLRHRRRLRADRGADRRGGGVPAGQELVGPAQVRGPRARRRSARPRRRATRSTTEKADGSPQHVPTGPQVKYDDAPPAFGSHWNEAGRRARAVQPEVLHREGPARARVAGAQPRARLHDPLVRRDAADDADDA